MHRSKPNLIPDSWYLQLCVDISHFKNETVTRWGFLCMLTWGEVRWRCARSQCRYLNTCSLSSPAEQLSKLLEQHVCSRSLQEQTRSPHVVYHHLWNENISRPHGQRNKVFVFTGDELYNPYRPQSWRRSYHHLTARHVVIPSCDAWWCSLKKRKRFDGRYVSLVDSQVRRRRLMHQCQRGKRVYHDSKAHNRIHKSYIKKWPKCVCSFCSLATWIHVHVNVAELSANCCKM